VSLPIRQPQDDPRLGRLPEFDERSRAYPIRTLVAGKPHRSYSWRVPLNLDQGHEGACVGFSWSHELAARPVLVKDVDDAFALRVYRRAQQLDEWPGEAYDGTSVLAGAKASVELGKIGEYRWAFGLDDLRLALGYAGPAVLGLNWYAGMFSPAADGRIAPTGHLMGGHAILAYRVDERNERVWLQNSWGASWGMTDRSFGPGKCWLSFADLDRLLGEDGEACIPVVRKR
jgi:hypothetical protein